MILTCQSFAKINLFLKITGKRSDGYHELSTLMTQINLHDDLYMDFDSSGISVVCDAPGVPEDDSNLAHRAADLFFDRAGSVKAITSSQRVQIRLHKRIPAGGGLGGGSSNAATVLMALNNHFGSPFSKKELMAMGLELGTDVPFFIFGRAALATGVGERLEPVPDLRPYHLVLCDPGVPSCTASVYKNMDFRLTLKPEYNKNTGLNVLIREENFDIRSLMHNDLEAPACRLYPEIREAKEEMGALLCADVYMTGSGSSLFALFSRREDAMTGYQKLLDAWRHTGKRVFFSSFR